MLNLVVLEVELIEEVGLGEGLLGVGVFDAVLLDEAVLEKEQLVTVVPRIGIFKNKK